MKTKNREPFLNIPGKKMETIKTFNFDKTEILHLNTMQCNKTVAANLFGDHAKISLHPT